MDKIRRMIRRIFLMKKNGEKLPILKKTIVDKEEKTFIIEIDIHSH